MLTMMPLHIMLRRCSHCNALGMRNIQHLTFILLQIASTWIVWQSRVERKTVTYLWPLDLGYDHAIHPNLWFGLQAF